MKIQIRKINVSHTEVEVSLLPVGVSYWKLRKYCSPYNTQFIRVVVNKYNEVKLLVLETAYSEFKVRFHSIGSHNAGEIINGNSKEFDYINEGFIDVLFYGKGEHNTGCVEITEVTEPEFTNELNVMVNKHLDTNG